MRKVAFVVACCLVALAAGPANAGPINISSITGVWVNPVGGSNLSGVGTSTVTWGDGDSPDSGYVFTPGANIINAPLGTALYLGLFTHQNEPIPSGSSITAIGLNFGFATNGLPASVGAAFLFGHNETTNATPCAPGSVSVCDDYVTVTQPIVNQLITVGTDVYAFNLLGFSKDGGNTIASVLSSREGYSNSAQLYGMLTLEQSDPVPEPASMLLFGTGLAAAAIRRRFRRS